MPRRWAFSSSLRDLDLDRENEVGYHNFQKVKVSQCERIISLPTHPCSLDRQYLLTEFLRCTAANHRAEWSTSLLSRISCKRM